MVVASTLPSSPPPPLPPHPSSAFSDANDTTSVVGSSSTSFSKHSLALSSSSSSSSSLPSSTSSATSMSGESSLPLLLPQIQTPLDDVSKDKTEEVGIDRRRRANCSGRSGDIGMALLSTRLGSSGAAGVRVSGGGGAPPALPASIPADDAAAVSTGARRRAPRVSLREYLENNRPRGDSQFEGEDYDDDDNDDDNEEEEDDGANDPEGGKGGTGKGRRRMKNRRDSRSRSRLTGGGRSVRSRTTKSLSSLRTDATGLISVREVRKAWGAMFFAAVLGSFVGTGGVRRMLYRSSMTTVSSPAEREPVPPLRSSSPRSGNAGDLTRSEYDRGNNSILFPESSRTTRDGVDARHVMDMTYKADSPNMAAESRNRAAARAVAKAHAKMESKLQRPSIRTVDTIKDRKHEDGEKKERRRERREGRTSIGGIVGAVDGALPDLELLKEAHEALLQREEQKVKEENKKKLKRGVDSDELDEKDEEKGGESMSNKRVSESDEMTNSEDKGATNAAVREAIFDSIFGVKPIDISDDNEDGGEEGSNGTDGDADVSEEGGKYAPVSGKRPNRAKNIAKAAAAAAATAKL